MVDVRDSSWDTRASLRTTCDELAGNLGGIRTSVDGLRCVCGSGVELSRCEGRSVQ